MHGLINCIVRVRAHCQILPGISYIQFHFTCMISYQLSLTILPMRLSAHFLRNENYLNHRNLGTTIFLRWSLSWELRDTGECHHTNKVHETFNVQFFFLPLFLSLDNLLNAFLGYCSHAALKRCQCQCLKSPNFEDANELSTRNHSSEPYVVVFSGYIPAGPTIFH